MVIRQFKILIQIQNNVHLRYSMEMKQTQFICKWTLIIVGKCIVPTGRAQKIPRFCNEISIIMHIPGKMSAWASTTMHRKY